MHNPYAQALEFLVDAGVTIALSDEPNNRFEKAMACAPEDNDRVSMPASATQAEKPSVTASADVLKEAETLAKNAKTLDDLRSAIDNFNGLSIKKTATQIVFADGNSKAALMVIGDAPNKDDDRNGTPFTDADGQLLDKILACINIERTSAYLTNLLNWRPPGGRSATDEEIAIAAIFLKKHIELVRPEYILCLGGTVTQILMNKKGAISRLRGEFHDYADGTKLLATYHPSSLLKTPLQKKKVWEDILKLQEVMSLD